MRQGTIKYHNLSVCFLLFSLALSLSSCYSRRVLYFTDLKDSTETTAKIPEVVFQDPVIQRYDILSITVQTMSNDDMTKIFSQSGDASVSNNMQQPGATSSLGYRVDKMGNIELPIIGAVKVEGLTLDQTRDLIREKVEKYYINPVVKVRFASYRITVLGDVSQPGLKMFATEKVTLLDLLSVSGDLQTTAKRDNILVIRQEDGYRSFGRLNMNSSNVFQSPYFYLKAGDVVYIEPNKAKIRTASIDRTNERFISYITTGLGMFVTIYSIFVLSNR